jgi:hypothetical protein
LLHDTLPTSGVGNISSDPQLASASHLSASSPCRGVGNGAWVSGTDIDGESWVNPPSMGCDEYHAGAVTGPLSVAISVSSTNVAVGYAVALTAQINGRTDLSVWDFGDGALEINQPYTAHSWSALGDYTVSLWAFSDSYPSGTNGTVIIHVVGPHYVAASSPNPTAPYSSWATAARNIQDAIAAATEAGTVVVLVTNGTYAPIMAYYPASLSVRSVNGALFTVIEGGHSNRCVTLGAGVSLSGFTLADGVAPVGGGAWGGTLNNCILVGNVTSNSYPGDGVGGGAFDCTLNNCTLRGNSGGSGGGAFDCTLNNCTLSGNSAYDSGGGASASVLNNCNLSGNSAWVGGGASYGYHFGSYSQCFLNNCTLNGNSAKVGGGAYVSVLNNCTLTGNSASGYNGNGCGGVYGSVLNNSILYFNTAPNDANFHQDQYTVLNSCCTTPQPTNGVGNITSAPLFVDQAAGNLRLQSNSPCINAGNNSYVTGATDLDGNPRIAGGTVDIGAYEFQSPTSIISYAWLQQYGLPIDSSTDTADPDADGVDNYHEWLAGTDPTNALFLPCATDHRSFRGPAQRDHFDLVHQRRPVHLAIRHQPGFACGLGHQFTRARRPERPERRHQSHHRPAAILPAQAELNR